MMTERLRKGWRVGGIGIEGLLSSLQAQGIPLYDICRVSPRCVTFYAPLSESKRIEALIRGHGFELSALPPEGWFRRLLTLRRRRFLTFFFAVALCLIFVSLQFVWRVQVTGAGVYRGEVNAWLEENGIRAGILRKNVNLAAISDGLLYRLPRVAWARAKLTGTTLRIEITEGTPQPDSETAESGDIVAACDGIIRSVEVYAGTAAVKPGDPVTAGQVLIRGKERGPLDASAVPVRAQGKVTARCWRAADAAVPLEETRSVPTGRQSGSMRFVTPWFSWPREDAPSYLTFDQEVTAIPLGGAWFPVSIKKTAYYEVALEKTQRDASAVQAEAGLLATRRLMAACDQNDEIIDEFLNFSIIEGKTILATATAELVADIGRFAPGISD